jgi:hypothetical protein
MTTLQETLRGMPSGKAHQLVADHGVTCTEGESTNDGSRQLREILGFTGDRLCESVAATYGVIASSNPIGDGATRSGVAELVAAGDEAMSF